MIAATFLATLFIPLFYVTVVKLFERKKNVPEPLAATDGLPEARRDGREKKLQPPI
jgi:hypothetical protein